MGSSPQGSSKLKPLRLILNLVLSLVYFVLISDFCEQLSHLSTYEALSDVEKHVSYYFIYQYKIKKEIKKIHFILKLFELIIKL